MAINLQKTPDFSMNLEPPTSLTVSQRIRSTLRKKGTLPCC